MKNCAQYIAAAKAALGDARMSDRELGEHIAYAQPTIAQAKAGKMSDGVALAIGEVLKRHGIVDHVGEVIVVAHAERDSDQRVRKSLMEYAWRKRSLPIKPRQLARSHA